MSCGFPWVLVASGWLMVILLACRPSGPPPPQVDTDTMLAFYQRLFPFRYLFQWLNHGVVPSPDFGNREFALTLQNDAYLRYQSYTTADL